MLLGKDKLNIIEFLISKTLIDLYISHDEFVSVNNILREYNGIKEEMETSVKTLYRYGWYHQKNVWKKWYRNNSR